MLVRSQLDSFSAAQLTGDGATLQHYKPVKYARKSKNFSPFIFFCLESHITHITNVEYLKYTVN